MDNNYSMSSTVVSTGDGTETLLAGSVPDLEFALVVVHFEGFEFEVDADGRRVVLVVGVVGEAQEDPGFAGALAAHDDDFEQVVVLFDELLHGVGGKRGLDLLYSVEWGGRLGLMLLLISLNIGEEDD